jgi:glycosyltransferase involved in cell wall biosynthesis
MPRFSVLLPTHNRADVIGWAIRSVLAQTEADFELLVVGDGCTDNTAAVVAAFRDPRIRWFDLPKAPHFGYANRNVALKQAAGDLIAYAAHDDLLLPDHLSRMSAALDVTAAEWAYSRPLWVSDEGVIVPYGPNLELADERETFLERANTIPSPCVAHRRSCFERFGYWREELRAGGDWDYWKRIVAGGTCAYERVPTAMHFNASWRAPRFAGILPVSALLTLAGRASWWPSALKVQIESGALPQAVIGETLSRSGLTWCDAIRRGVDTVIDRLALEMTSINGRA